MPHLRPLHKVTRMMMIWWWYIVNLWHDDDDAIDCSRDIIWLFFRSVSIPAPAYYAHLVAFRFYFTFANGKLPSRFSPAISLLFHFCHFSSLSFLPFLFFLTFAISLSCQMVQLWQLCTGLATTWFLFHFYHLAFVISMFYFCHFSSSHFWYL